MIIDEAPLRDGVEAWFTGRDLETGGGNLAHRRPHRPDDLARAREVVGRATSTSPARWHLMAQVHGADVGVVTERTPPGAQLRGVDALVTTLADRPLVVQVADCVPVLLAGARVVGVVHAGRAGIARGIVAATVRAFTELGDDPADVRALVGPAIGGCCYEVPEELRDEVAAVAPAAAASTTWGSPALDLPGAVTVELAGAGIAADRVGGCTRCDPQGRWFSHRADPGSGRQIGLVVRRARVPDAAATVAAP